MSAQAVCHALPAARPCGGAGLCRGARRAASAAPLRAPRVAPRAARPRTLAAAADDTVQVRRTHTSKRVARSVTHIRITAIRGTSFLHTLRRAQLATARLPADTNLEMLCDGLFQWAVSLTNQGSNLPFVLAQKVDRTPRGFTARCGACV
jgi:hypothetical protein